MVVLLGGPDERRAVSDWPKFSATNTKSSITFVFVLTLNMCCVARSVSADSSSSTPSGPSFPGLLEKCFYTKSNVHC
jgi:hypothetical protein